MTVEEMLDRMSSRELTGWWAYYRYRQETEDQADRKRKGLPAENTRGLDG